MDENKNPLGDSPSGDDPEDPFDCKKDGIFGKDFDKWEGCDECPIRSSCEAESKSRERDEIAPEAVVPSSGIEAEKPAKPTYFVRVTDVTHLPAKIRKFCKFLVERSNQRYPHGISYEDVLEAIPIIDTGKTPLSWGTCMVEGCLKDGIMMVYDTRERQHAYLCDEHVLEMALYKFGHLLPKENGE